MTADQPAQSLSSEATSELDSGGSKVDGVSAAPCLLERKPVRWLIRISVLYAGICIVMVAMESRLVFPGAYFQAPNWEDSDRFTPDMPKFGSVQTLHYTAKDESPLHGRLLLRENATRTVLFLHGNGIRAMEMDSWTRRLSQVMDATVLTAEYRGFQGDNYTPSEASTIEDAVSAIDALTQATDVSVSDVTVYGRSLGGGVAAGLVKSLDERDQEIRSLVLDRTFDSAAEVGQDQFFWLPVKLLLRNRYESVDNLTDYRGPVVQLHGPPDRVVPIVNGQRLFDSLATPNKVWIEVAGMRHNDRLPVAKLQQAYAELQRLEATNPVTQ